jgi:hypothetical protein
MAMGFRLRRILGEAARSSDYAGGPAVPVSPTLLVRADEVIE